MGQKVNPKSFRLGSLYSWSSNWFAKKGDYGRFLVEDVKLRTWLFERLKMAGVTEIKIDRSINTIKLTLFVARPGVVIGRGGSGLEELKRDVAKHLALNKSDDKAPKLELQVVEVKNPDISARLIGLRLADQLLRRYPHRRAIAQIMEKTMSSGAKGVKIMLSGRINGAEIARREKYFQGSIPLSTLRADVDYFEQPAFTKAGYVGIKVWVYNGEKQLR
jgi:small subunit ribosomal protein S3